MKESKDARVFRGKLLPLIFRDLTFGLRFEIGLRLKLCDLNISKTFLCM